MLAGIPALLSGCSQIMNTSTEKPGNESSRSYTTNNSFNTETVDDGESLPDWTASVQIHDYDIRRLDFANRPMQNYANYETGRCTIPTDELGTEPQLQTWESYAGEGHHPLRTSFTILQHIYCFINTDDRRYLERGLRLAEKYTQKGDVFGDSIYFPYGVSTRNFSQVISAPWYSGISQGVSLSAYTYLNEESNTDHISSTLPQVFNSISTPMEQTQSAWVSLVSDSGYFWIEEYPLQPPTHVLNGFLIGIWGLYDYYLEVGGEFAEFLLKSAITTVEENIHRYRVEGEYSLYSLGADTSFEDYHNYHIRFLRDLHRITQKPIFRVYAELFEADTSE